MFHVINYMTKNKDLELFFRVASLHLNREGFCFLIHGTIQQWCIKSLKLLIKSLKTKILKYQEKLFQIN